VYALNLTHSPENVIVWVTADRVDLTRRPCVTPRYRRAVHEPPGSQTASSRATIVEQSWRAEKLLGECRPSMMGQRKRRFSNGDSVAGREPV
jgi:hypothetical protein